jgi:hypothetical protein
MVLYDREARPRRLDLSEAAGEPGPIQTITAKLRVDDCNDLHRPRVHNHDLIADHEVIIPAPARLDCYESLEPE